HPFCAFGGPDVGFERRGESKQRLPEGRRRAARTRDGSPVSVPFGGIPSIFPQLPGTPIDIALQWRLARIPSCHLQRAAERPAERLRRQAPVGGHVRENRLRLGSLRLVL